MAKPRSAGRPGGRVPLRRALTARSRLRIFGVSFEDVIRWFFAANAVFSVVVLGLITLSLVLDSASFLPQNRANLERYRLSGEEWVDILREQMAAHQALVRRLNEVRTAEYFALEEQGHDFPAIRAELKPLESYREAYRLAGAPLEQLLGEMTALARATKQRAEVLEENVAVRRLSRELLAQAEDRIDQARTARHSAAGWLSQAQAWSLVPDRVEAQEAAAERVGAAEAFANNPPAPAAMAGQPGTAVPNPLQAEAAALAAGVGVNPLEEEARAKALADDGGNPIAAGAEAMRLSALLAALEGGHGLRPATARAALEEAVRREDANAARAVVLRLLVQASTAARQRLAEVEVTPIDFTRELVPLRALLPRYEQLNSQFHTALEEALRHPPELPTGTGATAWVSFRQADAAYVASLDGYAQRMRDWTPDEPVTLTTAFLGYVAGDRWVTNSDWMDWYGVVPLFVGSLCIAAVALALAVPFGVGAAIYINQFATLWEQRLIKPYIEFIAAIPSVVLGFFGIAVLGDVIRNVSGWALFSWLPGFPIAERLNITTAGVLLALMAVPTIFTLSEDAIDSVPRESTDASYALGATRLQTLWRVILPASVSGVVSAVLLGFGRVVGETMVVLLVAGNRIAVPDFNELGLAAFFQPVHTMTGIIAQETGEVSPGTLHYHGLFMVGITLFAISLLVNFFAQLLVRRYRVPTP